MPRTKLKTGIIAFLTVMLVISAVHRLWLQFRPIPVRVGFVRAFTQNELNEWMKRQGVVPPGTVWDTRPYPDGKVVVSKANLLLVRAMASWCWLMPWRQTGIEIRTPTDVRLLVYEKHNTELRFTKAEFGWTMTPDRPQCILRVSEDNKPWFSFH